MKKAQKGKQIHKSRFRSWAMGRQSRAKQSTPHPRAARLRFPTNWKRWAARATVLSMLASIPSGHGYPIPTPHGIGVTHTGVENGRKATVELDRFLERTRFPVVLTENANGTKESNAQTVLAFQKAIQTLQTWKKQKSRTSAEIDASARSLANQIYAKMNTTPEEAGTQAFRIEWASFLIRKGIVPRSIEEYTPEQIRRMNSLYTRSNDFVQRAFDETNVGRAFALLEQSEVARQDYMRQRDAGIQEGYARFRKSDSRSSPFVIVGQGHLKGLQDTLPMNDLTEENLGTRATREGMTSFTAKRMYVYRWVERYQKNATTAEQKAMAANALQRVESLTPEELESFASIDGKSREDLVIRLIIKLNEMSR